MSSAYERALAYANEDASAQGKEIEQAPDGMGTSLRKGFTSGVYGAGSQLQSVAGMAGELVGADEFAQDRYKAARGLRDEAQAAGPEVGTWEQVHGLRDLGNYAAGIVGGSAPVSLAAMGAGALTGGVLPAMAAAGAVTAPFEIGDVIQKQQADPEAMRQSLGGRALGAVAGGVGSAAFQGIVPGLVGKQLARGTAGVAKQSLKGIYGRNVLGDAALEAGAEGGGEAIKQLGANQEAPLDWNAIKENAIGGIVGGGAMGHIGMTGDLVHSVAPRASEMYGSARTSINDRLAAAKASADEKLTAAGETAPGKKVKSAWDDVSDLIQRGREKFDDTVDKVLKGEELGIDIKEMATATGQRAKEMMDISDNEHIKAATKWADEMLADKGLDAAKRTEIMEAAKNVTERSGQVAMAGLKKAWDLGREGVAKVNDFVDAVRDEHAKVKRADVDVESRTVDEPTAELERLGYSRAAPAADVTDVVAKTPAPRTTIKDRKAFIEAKMAEGMSREEARALFVESMNEPRKGMPEPPEMPKLSEDYSGANEAVAKAIQESGIASKRPELFGNNESINKMADALRIVAEQAAKGKLSERVSDKMVDVFGKDAPHMINTITRVLAGANLDPAKSDLVFQSINSLNRANKTREGLHGFLRESLTEDSFKSNLARDLPKLADTLVKHARGELTAKSTPAEAQAINEAMAGVLEDHFGPNAAAVSKRIEQEARRAQTNGNTQNFDSVLREVGVRPLQGPSREGLPNMEKSGGAEFDDEVLTDENGAELDPSEGGFDENGNRLSDAEQNITRYGLSKADVNGRQRNVVNGAMMHKDSQYVEKYLNRLKERHSTLDDEGRVVRTAEENGYDIRFEPAEGSEYGHIVVEDRRDPDSFNADELARMKLDTKNHPKSASRIEVGWKVVPEHESTNSKGVTKLIPEKQGPEHILDATKIMDVLRSKAPLMGMTVLRDTTARQRMADGFAQGIATLNMKYGSKEHPIVVGDDVVIGYINAKPVTWGEARKLDTRTEKDKLRDGDARRQEEIRAEYAKAKKITPDRAHNALIRAYRKDLEAVGGDKTQVLPKLAEYVDLWQAHQRVLAIELSGGRDTQEPSRLPASTAAPRTNIDAKQDKLGREVTVLRDRSKPATSDNTHTFVEYSGRGATYAGNNSFGSETGDRKDTDKSGNIHELRDSKPAMFGGNAAKRVYRNKDDELIQHEPQATLTAKQVTVAQGDFAPNDGLVHRSNMDGSAHWAGADRGIGGLNTLAGTIAAEWSKTPGVAAKKVLDRVKRLVSVAASMSKADQDKLRMLAPDPLVNRKGGPVDYNDRYTANDTLNESMAKMSEKQAIRELTRRENLFDGMSNKRSDFARALLDEITGLEEYLDGGKFGTGAGIQDSLTLGEAAPVINELARKYRDVIMPPDRASAGPIKPETQITGSVKYPKPTPTNPIRFDKTGVATNGVRGASEAEPDAGHWEKRGSKHFWVEGTKRLAQLRRREVALTSLVKKSTGMVGGRSSKDQLPGGKDAAESVRRIAEDDYEGLDTAPKIDAFLKGAYAAWKGGNKDPELKRMFDRNNYASTDLGMFYGGIDTGDAFMNHDAVLERLEAGLAASGKGSTPSPKAQAPAMGATAAKSGETRYSLEATRIHGDLRRDGFAATHDSPYKHEGKFDWRTHIGKGEGNASFGAGTYLSTADGVHGFYKSQFTAQVDLDAKDRLKDDPEYAALRNELFALYKKGIVPADAISAITSKMFAMENALPKGPSPTYEVSVNIKPEQLLDWDAPLSEQSELVQKALAKAGFKDKSALIIEAKDRLARAKQALKDIKGEERAAIDKHYDSMGFNNAVDEVFAEFSAPETSRDITLRFVGKINSAYDAITSAEVELKRAQEANQGRLSGGDIYHSLTGRLGSQAAASDYLQSRGILGHKYAAAGGHNDTRPNYVIYDDSKITTNYVHFSAQSTNPNINNAKSYNAQDIRDHIEKVLGKSVKLAWATFTHAGQFDRTKAGDIIRLSIHALDPMSTAYHESLHAFFAQLRDAGATDIIDVVQKAANSEHVIRQLEDKFMNQPAVLKQLRDPEERAAYMYQMWAADPKGFKVSINAKTVLQRIAAFIRKVMGTWSNDERAEHIMNYFHEGKYARDMGSPNAVRNALMETHKSQILETARGFTEPLGKLADAVVGAGGDRLRNTGIPALGELADIIKRDATTQGGDQGFIQASRIQSTKMRTALGEILNGLSKEQIGDVMEAMQANKPAISPEARLAVREIKGFLARTRKYMVNAGVNLGNLGPDYFPRIWDTHYISKNQKSFRDMLEPYIRSGQMEGTADELIRRLISHDGAELGIESRETTQPGMQHTKERLLSFIKPADAAQFVEKNLHATLGNYINQASRKAEWTRRLGKGKLQQLMADARSQGATKEHLTLAEDYMKGVDGTLGDGMNLTARRITGNLIVYQNVRLLPMAAFSMLIDPVGIVVRGGEVRDAWGAFKRGMVGITQTFSKNGGEASDQGTKWAELVGAVDTAMMSHVMGDVYSQGMVGGTAQNINNAYFKYNFVEGLNRNFRIGAVQAAVRFIGRHAGGVDGLGSSAHSKRWMRELGLRKGDIIKVGDHIAMTEADGLTAEQVARVHAAINQWVDGAVLRPDAADKPIWMNDPHYALIAHLKQFVFTFQKIILGRVMHEMRHGNYTPMMALASYVPIMIAADTAKGLLQGGGDTPEWKKGWGVSDYVGYGIQRAGLLGVGQFGLDFAEDLHRGGVGVGALTGPTIEQMTEILQTAGGRRSVGSTMMDALPANQMYKEMLSGGSDGGPTVTG